MSKEPTFRADLYRGTARFYDQFRVPYPAVLLDDLCRRTGAAGAGRLLDLACGTGQISFALADRFARIVAVDQEGELIEFARAKALDAGITTIEWMVARAEDLDDDESFDLVAIGNAFHRLPRSTVAARAMGWLRPGGHLALLWSSSPWEGGLAWQQVLAQVMEGWKVEAGTAERVPDGLDRHLAAEPHEAVLRAAGFTVLGDFEVAVPHRWTVDELAGFLFSTSVLSHAALGRHVDAFASDLRTRLLAVDPTGEFGEDISFRSTLAVTTHRAGDLPAEEATGR